MATLDEALNDWLDSVKKKVDLTPTQLAEISGTGAEKLQKIYTETTKEEHYSSHDDKVYGHMADHITMQKKNIDGDVTGVSSVGWDNVFHAANARRLNDGTRQYHADHFVTNIRESDATQKAVLEAEFEAYKKMTGGDD